MSLDEHLEESGLRTQASITQGSDPLIQKSSRDARNMDAGIHRAAWQSM